MRASGLSGVLRAGYQEAALLGRWTLEPAGRGFSFRALITHKHQHWIAQRPLDLCLSLGKVEWTWRDVAIEFEGTSVVISIVKRPEVTARPAQHHSTRSIA